MIALGGSPHVELHRHDAPARLVDDAGEGIRGRLERLRRHALLAEIHDRAVRERVGDWAAVFRGVGPVEVVEREVLRRAIDEAEGHDRPLKSEGVMLRGTPTDVAEADEDVSRRGRRIARSFPTEDTGRGKRAAGGKGDVLIGDARGGEMEPKIAGGGSQALFRGRPGLEIIDVAVRLGQRAELGQGAETRQGRRGVGKNVLRGGKIVTGRQIRGQARWHGRGRTRRGGIGLCFRPVAQGGRQRQQQGGDEGHESVLRCSVHWGDSLSYVDGQLGGSWYLGYSPVPHYSPTEHASRRHGKVTNATPRHGCISNARLLPY